MKLYSKPDSLIRSLSLKYFVKSTDARQKNSGPNTWKKYNNYWSGMATIRIFSNFHSKKIILSNWRIFLFIPTSSSFNL